MLFICSACNALNENYPTDLAQTIANALKARVAGPSCTIGVEHPEGQDQRKHIDVNNIKLQRESTDKSKAQEWRVRIPR